MDIQFYGANCVALSYKSTRLVVDDNLAELGKKSVSGPNDVVLFTSLSEQITSVKAKLVIDNPGEYEVADISIIGIPARSHMDEEGKQTTVMYKLNAGDTNILISGHVYPRFSEQQIETIGSVDALIAPVGGHGYTLDPAGALTLIKAIEPKLLIPTHFDDKELKYPVPQLSLTDALKELSMEPKETVIKLRIKPAELGDVTQLVVLQTS